MSKLIEVFHSGKIIEWFRKNKIKVNFDKFQANFIKSRKGDQKDEQGRACLSAIFINLPPVN